MLTGRQTRLLEVLLNNVQGVRGEKLSEYLEVSSRTIRNEIGEINRSWKNGTIIQSSKKRGYYIEAGDLDSVREYLFSERHSRSEKELLDRGWLILGMVLETGKKDIFEIGEALSLSEAAVYKEAVKFRKYLLEEYSCELLRIGSERIWIEEEERKIRQTLFRIIKNEAQKGTRLYFYFLKSFLPNSFETQEYELLISLVKKYFDEKHVQITDANLYMIVSAIYITIVRNMQNHKTVPLEKIEPEDIMNHEFFAYLKEQGILLGDGDIQVLSGLLHGFKLTNNPVVESNISDISRLIFDDFCRDIMEKYHFDLRQSQEFQMNLLIHIEYMVRRIETGYEIRNPILAEVKNQYPYAYEISMLIVQILYRYKNYFIRDDEVSYIAIFVQYFLENINQRLKAVVISSSRFSVSTIITSWIETNFQKQIEIVDMLPQHNLDKYLDDHSVDLIISTTELVAHPDIMTFRIDEIPNRYTEDALNALVHKIRMNYRFKEIIKENFNKNVIRIYQDKTEFETVIRELSEDLKSEDCIYDVDEYVEDVLQREVGYPTFIGDWFMIPHPLMTFAKKTTIGVAVLKQPIRMQKKEIQLIFLLAMERKHNEQIGALFQFFKHMALDRATIGKLASVENKGEFIDMLIKVSNITETR